MGNNLGRQVKGEVMEALDHHTETPALYFPCSLYFLKTRATPPTLTPGLVWQQLDSHGVS